MMKELAIHALAMQRRIDNLEAALREIRDMPVQVEGPEQAKRLVMNSDDVHEIINRVLLGHEGEKQ